VTRRHGVAGVGAVLLIVGLSAGCSNGTSINAPFSTKPQALLPGAPYEVTTGKVSGLGTVVVDGQGITLYMFATDVRGEPSRCYDICAVQWPPVVLPAGVTRPVAGPGIDAALLGSASRVEGTTQVTYNGWPLYVWPPDKGPGEATGQALTNAGGHWYVLSPSGTPIMTQAP